MKKLLFLLSLVVGMASCSNEELELADNKTSTFIHCNWGWNGRNNGYYISKAFNTNAGAIIYDNAGDYQASGTSNYKYHLQYSIINR